MSTRCVPLKKIAKDDWQFDNSLGSSNKACAFSTRDFSFEDPVIYKFVELNTNQMPSVELKQYIKLDAATNIGEHYGIEETSFSRSEDQTIMPISTQNSHIPVRVNIVEKGEVIQNELSVKPNAESKVSLGNCGNNIDLDAANEFCLNVLEFKGLNLGFTRITGDYNRNDREDKENKKHDDCYLPELSVPNGYPDVSPEQVTRFIESIEATTFLPSLLPLSRLHASVLITKRGSKNFILGNCDNGEVSKEFLHVMPKRSGSSKKEGYKGGEGTSPFSGKYFTYGLLKDIRNLKMERAEWRGKNKYDKLFAVVSKDYFLYHKLHKSLDIPKSEEIYGFSLTPVFRETLRDTLLIFNHDDHPWSFLGDVAFIREDQLNAGTLSHELAHLLGQRKDFYNLKSPDCRPFQGISLEEIPLKKCEDYRIPKALYAKIISNKLSWSFVKDRYSIMDNKQGTEQLWIDRESHQRVFSVMAKVNRVIQENKWQQSPQLGYFQQNSAFKKILVAGFYHKERDKFIVPQVKTLETTLSTPSYPEQLEGNGDYLTLLLKDEKEDKTLQKIIRPFYKTHLGFLHQKEHSKETACKAVPFDFSYLHVAFDIPEYRNLEDLKVVVLGPKGNEIFSSPVPKEE